MTSVPSDTYTVSALAEELRELLAGVYPRFWVAGEVQSFRPSANGHVFLELVEKGRGDRIEARLDAVIWRRDWERLDRLLQREGVELQEGRSVRVFGNLDFYGPQGRLQLMVRDIDPVFTAGVMAQRKRETLRALQGQGLLERNGVLELPMLPLAIGLVTAHDSAAYHDFVATLRESGIGFRLSFAAASVQGDRAEREILAALDRLGRHALDCIVIVRGGGSRSDLAVFDTRRVSEAVCRAPLPVLVGLGHEIDRSIVDLAAHSSFKTPTGVAEFLVGRATAARQRVDAVRQGLGRGAQRSLDSGRSRLERVGKVARVAGRRLRHEHRRLQELGERGRVASRRRIEQATRRRLTLARALGSQIRPRLESGTSRCNELQRALQRAFEVRLEATRRRVEGASRLIESLSPDRVLERGFSITRDASGRLLRSSRDVESGARVETLLIEDGFWSRVE